MKHNTERTRRLHSARAMAGCRRWTSAAERLPPSALTSTIAQSKRAAIGASKIRLPLSEPMIGTTHDGCLGATVEAASVTGGTPKASSDKVRPILGCARKVVETNGTVDGLRDRSGRHNRLQRNWSSPIPHHAYEADGAAPVRIRHRSRSCRVKQAAQSASSSSRLSSIVIIGKFLSEGSSFDEEKGPAGCGAE